MVSSSKILSSDIAKKIVEKAGEIIKSGKAPTKAEDLLNTKKKDIIIGGEKKATVTADGETETVLKLSKAGLKKKVPDIAEEVFKLMLQLKD